MAVLQKGKSNYPFWGASINLITGLDPLVEKPVNLTT
ncbi:hypothetical protein FLAT13_01972 [Flavobacterium salmonis]|uniref:Uncharacterized protein n=1 Tax=Flavobacterium salmonis TaxID=2654844 RepID=A0A6V6YWU9_9FLAO|nr:hypothetical protein FLAT13_01972 [Flavobacterium salmonis]